MVRRRGNKSKALQALTLTMAAALAASGCSGNTEKEANSSPSAAVSASPTQKAAGTEPVELTWMVNDVMLPDSFGEKFVEEKFNVKLNIVSIPRADYAQRQQIMMTTGEVPDVMLVMDPNEMKKYAEQGLLAEVPMETIEQYAPRTKAEIDKNASQGWFYTNHKGVNYGVPTLFGGKTTTPGLWRVDLLEKAGIQKIPETIDEMTTAFEALKKIGVYGMSTNGNSDYAAFQKIFGAFGVMPIQWMAKDGQVTNGAVMPEAKEALTLLADWYGKGYIDPEFVTGKNLGEKHLDGVYAYNDTASIYSTDESSSNSTISALKAVNPAGKVEFGTLPKGPRGESGGWSWDGCQRNIVRRAAQGSAGEDAARARDHRCGHQRRRDVRPARLWHARQALGLQERHGPEGRRQIFAALRRRGQAEGGRHQGGRDVLRRTSRLRYLL